MLECPGCKAPLPASARTCHACGREILAPPPAPKLGRPVPRAQQANDIQLGPSWAPQAYRVVAWIWVGGGAAAGLLFLLIAIRYPVAWLGVALGAFHLLVGIGLVKRLPRIRRLVTWASVAQMLEGLGSLWEGFWGGNPLGMLVGFGLLAVGAFTIFLIGETDAGPPEI